MNQPILIASNDMAEYISLMAKPPTSHISVGGQEELLAGEACHAASPQDEQQVHRDLQEAEDEEGRRCLHHRSHLSCSADRSKEYLRSHHEYSLLCNALLTFSSSHALQSRG